jgi:hypothetical protein
LTDTIQEVQLAQRYRLILRYFECIWHVQGSFAIDPGQSSADAFDRLDPLFREHGTSFERTSDTLFFRKKDQAAQDEMSIFDWGILQIKKDTAGLVLYYRLASRALLFCFLAPLLFLGFAGLTMAVSMLEKPPTEAEKKIEKAKKEKAEQEKAKLPQSAVDKFFGAPAPENPKKDDKKGSKKAEEDDAKHSPTSAYVFAAIFAALYVLGRILEDRLIKKLFQKKLRVRPHEAWIE